MLRALGRMAVAATVLFGAAEAMADSRLALVIGQSAYKAVPALPNPVNDAKAIAQMLGEAGFEVTAASDLGQIQLREVVGDFAGKLAAKGPDTVALVFYAGHGIQVDGENYLIPIDVDPKREADIPLQAVRLNDVLNTLASAPGKTRIIMLDACRNNPFPQLSGTTGHGLALIDTRAGAPGTLLSYSTSPGAEAEDGDGANSPYTSALLKAGRETGLQIEDTLKRVRLAVNKATSGRQTPWESSSLVDDFRFFGSADTAANADAKLGNKKQSSDEWRALLKGKPAEEAHALIVADGSGEAYEAFVSLYAEPPYGAETRLWLDRHRRMQAWSRAVLVNTASSYRGFLSLYPDSDLTATAKKLEDRTRNRPEPVAAAAAAATLPAPTNAALTCPCNAPPTPPVLEKPKKADAKKSKRAEEDVPRRGAKKPVRGRYYEDDDDVVVVPRRPVIIDTPAPIGFGGGYRGGYRGPTGPSYPGGGYQGGGRIGIGR